MGKLSRRLLLAAALILGGCGGEPAPVAPEPAAPEPAPLYFAALAKPLGAYPEAGIRGTFRVVEGCALLDDALLVFPSETRLAPTTASSTTVLFGGIGSQQLRPGMTVSGGGGGYDLSYFTAPDAGWPLREPVPERCATLTDKAVLVAPGARLLSAPVHAERLYAAVLQHRVGPGLLAPVGGILRVEDQCLLLDDRLVLLPAHSFVQFDSAGQLEVHIAAEYHQTVLARPGDRISGGGGGVTAESEPLPASPRPLIEPIPARCRPPGRRAVLLNRGPDVVRAARATYADPSAADTAVVPRPAPPPPVSDPARCPSRSRLDGGFCRLANGDPVPPLEPR